MTEAVTVVVAILLWGFIATVSTASIMFMSQGLGWSRLSLPFLIGTMFTADRHVANVLGFLFYMIGGWLFALVYYLLFASLGRAGWEIGLLAGSIHALFLLAVLLPLLPHMHPRMATPYDGPTAERRLEPPGFLALHYGYRTPLVTVIAHMAYGGILGAALPET
jgi:uncharacterized membrane protein YagU involved in acid resistance